MSRFRLAGEADLEPLLSLMGAFYAGEGYDFVAEAFCREHGVRALHLEVEHENPRAQELYRRTGYVDHHRYLMTKRL